MKPPVVVQMALAHTSCGRYVRVGDVTHPLLGGYPADYSVTYEIATARHELWRLGLKWQDVTEWRLPLSRLLPRNRRKTTTAYRRELARQVGAEEREMPQFVEAL